eukprot:1160334-Pyramimonas_sp.AAC.1
MLRDATVIIYAGRRNAQESEPRAGLAERGQPDGRGGADCARQERHAMAPLGGRALCPTRAGPDCRPRPPLRVLAARPPRRCAAPFARSTTRYKRLLLREVEDRGARRTRTRTDRTVEGPATAVGLKRTGEAEQEAYRRCKTARQTDLR